jgi:hypothetical protein
VELAVWSESLYRAPTPRIFRILRLTGFSHGVILQDHQILNLHILNLENPRIL